jgi:hypothetical protein
MSTGFTPFLLQLRSRQDLAENPYLLYYAEARLAVHWNLATTGLGKRENAVISAGVGWSGLKCEPRFL